MKETGNKVYCLTKLLEALTETALLMVRYLFEPDCGNTEDGFSVLRQLIDRYEKEFSGIVVPSPIEP